MCRVSFVVFDSINTLFCRQLLNLGYRVVFLHRNNSLLPFVRTFTTSSLFDAMDAANGDFMINPEKKAAISSLVAARRLALKEGRLLQISFVTVVVRWWMKQKTSWI